MNERVNYLKEWGYETCVFDMIQKRVTDLWAIYMFGSAGTSAMRAESDVDLAFLSRGAVDPTNTWALAQDIAAVLDRDVDLVNMRQASTVMAAQIITKGSRLLTVDDTRCAEFEARALADYARLNEERGVILDSIAQRGRIHA